MQSKTKCLFSDEFLSASSSILISCMIDEAWPIEYISKNILQFGYKSNKLIKKNTSFKDIVHPEDIQRVQDEIEEYILDGHDSFYQTYRILAKNKTVHWVEEEKVIKRSSDKKITHYIGLITDITDRKQVNPKTEPYKQFIEICNDAVYVIDYETSDFIEVNKNACKMLGYSKERLLTKSILSISEVINNKKQWNEFIVNTKNFTDGTIIEDVHFQSDGNKIPVEISIKYQIYDDKKIFVATVRNISKRKQAENALQKERQFLQHIIDGIADPLLVIDTDYNVILSNQAQTDFKSAGSLGKVNNKCYHIAHGRDTVCQHSGTPCSLQEVLKTGQPVSFIHQHHFNNADRIHKLIASPLRDDDGKIKAIIEINHDVTDLIKTKQLLVDKEIKLKQLIKGRAEMVDLITNLVVDFIGATRENMDELIDNGLSLIGQLTEVDRCCLFSFEYNLASTSNTHEWCRKTEYSQKNILQNIPTKPYKCIYRQLKKGKAIHVPDIDDLDSCLADAKYEFKKQNIKSVLIVPMHMNGNLDGVLGFVSVDGLKTWSDEDVNLLLLLGKIITATRIRIQTEMHLHHSKNVMKSILDTMDAMVYVCDQKNHELLFVNKKVQEMIGDNVRTVCLEGTKTSNDFKSGLCDFCTNNASTDSVQAIEDFQVWDFQSKMNKHWYHCRAKNFSWIDGRKVRLVVTTDISERVNSEQTNKKLFTENSKLIHEILKSTENERKYLARELHDEMGQLITAIRLEADFLQQECQDHSDDVVSSIREITSISSDVLSSIRNVTNRLRPSAMTQNSIVDTLKELHYNWKKHNRNILSSFQVVGEVSEISDSISIVLYRVLQECLTNIVRHASDSKQVTISLFSGFVDGLPDNIINDTEYKKNNYSMITLMVEDDGKGFDVNASHIGIGISGMRERLQSVDGKFQLTSETGIGTKIVASLPLSNQELFVENEK